MTNTSTLEELVALAAQGDRVAANFVMEAIQDDVYRLSFRMLGPSDAQDASQEVLVKVLTHLGSFRGESRFKTWVYRVAANHLMNLRRGKQEGFSLEMM